MEKKNLEIKVLVLVTIFERADPNCSGWFVFGRFGWSLFNHLCLAAPQG